LYPLVGDHASTHSPPVSLLLLVMVCLHGCW
jgi:hypothetical protein